MCFFDGWLALVCHTWPRSQPRSAMSSISICGPVGCGPHKPASSRNPNLPSFFHAAASHHQLHSSAGKTDSRHAAASHHQIHSSARRADARAKLAARPPPRAHAPTGRWLTRSHHQHLKCRAVFTGWVNSALDLAGWDRAEGLVLDQVDGEFIMTVGWIQGLLVCWFGGERGCEERARVAKLGPAAVLAYGLFDAATYTTFFVLAFLGYEKSTGNNPAANLKALLCWYLDPLKVGKVKGWLSFTSTVLFCCNLLFPCSFPCGWVL